jgi:hypothetical protein
MNFRWRGLMGLPVPEIQFSPYTSKKGAAGSLELGYNQKNKISIIFNCNKNLFFGSFRYVYSRFVL